MNKMKVKNQKLNVLAIIGARSGSKGVANKNIRNFLGKPLLSWVVAAAKASKTVTRVIVSTDSENYAKIARSHGAETPYIRPDKYATDSSPEIEFIIDLLKTLKHKENYIPNIVVRLLPTVPLQSALDIDKCVNKLIQSDWADSSVVISEARQHPEKALRLVKRENGEFELKTYITFSSKDVTPIGRQKYSKAFFRANIIACWNETILETHSLTGESVTYVEIDGWRGHDIDTESDFVLGELIANNMIRFENSCE